MTTKGHDHKSHIYLSVYKLRYSESYHLHPEALQHKTTHYVYSSRTRCPTEIIGEDEQRAKQMGKTIIMACFRAVFCPHFCSISTRTINHSTSKLHLRRQSICHSQYETTMEKALGESAHYYRTNTNLSES